LSAGYEIYACLRAAKGPFVEVLLNVSHGCVTLAPAFRSLKFCRR